jgi:hypothetical protein
MQPTAKSEIVAADIGDWDIGIAMKLSIAPELLDPLFPLRITFFPKHMIVSARTNMVHYGVVIILFGLVNY